MIASAETFLPSQGYVTHLSTFHTEGGDLGEQDDSADLSCTANTYELNSFFVQTSSSYLVSITNNHSVIDSIRAPPA